MQFYNKIMTWFWLFMGFVSSVIVTYMGIKQGFGIWLVYYTFSIVSFGMYFLRRWMTKRMEKHVAWLEEQKRSENRS